MPLGPLSQPGASARVPTVTASVSASAIAGTVTGTAGGATISFTASDNPGKPSGNYVATSSPSGFTSSASVSPISFSSGVLAAGTAYTFSVVKQSGSGISSNASTPSGSVTAFTIPNAPVLTLTNTDNTVDWSWVSGGDGGNAITHWEYSVSTNGGAYGASASVAVGTTGYPGTIDNYRNINYYKLRVRALNAAGWSAYAESGNSTQWVRTIGSEITETVYDSYTASGCTAACCGGCGTQSYQRRKFSQRQTRTDTWTRLTSTNTQYVVVTNFTGDTNGDGVVDNWGLVSAFTSCEAIGSCIAGSTGTLSGTDGQIVYVGGTAGQDYRTYSSFFGAWAVTNSSGTYTMQVGQCGGSCSAQNCFAFSTSITYCNGTPCQQYTAVGYTQLGACANFGFGCTGAGSC